MTDSISIFLFHSPSKHTGLPPFPSYTPWVGSSWQFHHQPRRISEYDINALQVIQIQLRIVFNGSLHRPLNEQRRRARHKLIRYCDPMGHVPAAIFRVHAPPPVAGAPE
jgi:hypothetical protein